MNITNSNYAALSVAIACGALTGCSDGDTVLIEGDASEFSRQISTEYDLEQSAEPVPGDIAEPEIMISSQLDIEGESLVLKIVNLTGVSGSIRFSTSIENPEALFFTPDAGYIDVGALEETSFRWAKGDVDGLELSQQEWTDANISYQYTMEDGSSGVGQASMFAEYNQASAYRPVVSSGRSHGFIELDSEESPPVLKSSSVFTICFRHSISFPAEAPVDIDYFHGPNYSSPSARGIRVRGNFDFGGMVESHYLDGSGCTTFPRLVGLWSFRAELISNNWPYGPLDMRAETVNGTIPSTSLGDYYVWSDTSSLGTKTITMPSGDYRDLQTAWVVSQHTIARASSLGSVVKDNSELTIKLRTTGGASYVHSDKTIYLSNASARLRYPASHETGHWIRHIWTSHAGGLDTYCTPGQSPSCQQPPNDGCYRPTGGHGQDSITWQSMAHNEGFADFIAMLAYNNSSANADCWLPNALVTSPVSITDCEAVGKYMETGNVLGDACYEWTNSIFTKVGNEYDWAKMYWDLFVDETGLGASRLRDYLQFESTVGLSSWGAHTNDIGLILGAMSGTPMDAALRRAAVGNIWSGSAH